MSNQPLILGIETSCDETAVGIVRGRTLLANVISSSVEEHARFGGVVPEIASRAHLEAMPSVIKQALSEAKVALKDIDAIGVTAGPGLIGALLVGTSAAQGLSLALNKPVYGVNHLSAHLAVDALDESRLLKPAIGLLVSGGHSSIIEVTDMARGVKVLGQTIDDAAGEAFDKIARLLELDFPGGPSIDRLARRGATRTLLIFRVDYKIRITTFHLVDLRPRSLDISGRAHALFALILLLPFQEAVVDVLLTKALRACTESGIDALIIAGGVAANSRLRAEAAKRCAVAGIELRIPPAALCTD